MTEFICNKCKEKDGSPQCVLKVDEDCDYPLWCPWDLDPTKEEEESYPDWKVVNSPNQVTITPPTYDPVNKPSHYTEGRKFEPIDVIEDWELDFCLGNALKYISRAGRKENMVQDLKKAKWYIERRINQMNGKA